MWKESKSGSMQEFYSLPLGYAGWKDEEIAFMYLGNSGIILRMRGRTIAFDVADLLSSEEVNAMQNLDIMLFTHGHEDHYKLKNTLEIFNATEAHIVAEPQVANDLRGEVPTDKLVSAEPGGTYNIGDIKVTAISGVHRGPINLYHVETGGLSILHCGDSGHVSLKEHAAKIAFIPTGNPSPTASPKDALRMALECRPKVAVAIHGSKGQSKEFEKEMKKQMAETIVIVPERYNSKKVAV
jgi:L-ascorbate metabolism protein UlaG (beta-lactamase superfamily)